MTDLRKAAEMALEAMDDLTFGRVNKFPDARKALRQALAQPEQEPVAKVWLWRNFVNDKPEYWAFDNPYPINLDNDDPQTIGSPCGYALLKPSRDGSRGRKEDEVLREIKGALAREQTRHQALAQPEKPVAWADKVGAVIPHSHKLFQPDLLKDYTRPLYTAPPKREWVGLTDTERSELEDKYKHIETGWRHDADLIAETEAKLKEKNT